MAPAAVSVRFQRMPVDSALLKATRRFAPKRTIFSLRGLHSFILGALMTCSVGVGATVFDDFLQRAKAGDAEAQNLAGLAYSKGDGVARNPREALTWLQKSADGGYATGQLNLAYLYYRGDGVPKDLVRAAMWLQRAADQGQASAQFNLAAMYERGEGIQANYAEAMKYYRLAANQGNALAQYSLGVMHYTGHGVPANAAVAVQWYQQAAERGLPVAQFMLGTAYGAGQGVAADQGEADRWLKRAAMQGHRPAVRSLAERFNPFTPRVQPADPAEAYRRSLIKRDSLEAYAWYTVALKLGDRTARGGMESVKAGMTAPQVEAAAKLAASRFTAIAPE